MKNLIFTLLIPVLSVQAFSQKVFQTQAILAKENGENFQAWILAATSTGIRYKTTAISTDFKDAKLTDFSTVFLKEPAEYSEAMDLFQGRKYKEAQVKFAEVKETYKPIAGLKDNFHTLAGYYEMECMRKQGDLEGLASALKSFIKAPLTRDFQIRQLDLYVLWDAVRTKAWERILPIAAERDEELLPGDQRAQVAYCKGLALENLERLEEALVAYNVAITADAGASEQIAQDAAIGALRVYFADKEVQTAIQVWETKDENKNSGGYGRLIEAANLAAFYDKYLKVDKPLPENLKKFVNYLQPE